jgi:hypothetical protein
MERIAPVPVGVLILITGAAIPVSNYIATISACVCSAATSQSPEPGDLQQTSLLNLRLLPSSAVISLRRYAKARRPRRLPTGGAPLSLRSGRSFVCNRPTHGEFVPTSTAIRTAAPRRAKRLQHSLFCRSHTSLRDYLTAIVQHAIAAGLVSQVHADRDPIGSAVGFLPPRTLRCSVILLHGWPSFGTWSADQLGTYGIPPGRPAFSFHLGKCLQTRGHVSVTT